MPKTHHGFTESWEADLVYAIVAVMGFTIIMSIIYCCVLRKYLYGDKVPEMAGRVGESEKSFTSSSNKSAFGFATKRTVKIMKPSENFRAVKGADEQLSDEEAPLMRTQDSSLGPSQNAKVGKLRTTLADGKDVILLTSKGPKRAKMKLKDNQLRWKTSSSSGSVQKYKLDLHDVLFVYEGISTKSGQITAESVTNEKLCISLVAQENTLDIQLETEQEQALFLKGFNALINDLRK
jgi:hypothetical protein